MQFTEGVSLPSLRVSTVAAAAAARLAHFVLVVPVGGNLEAFYAEHACVIHAWNQRIIVELENSFYARRLDFVFKLFRL